MRPLSFLESMFRFMRSSKRGRALAGTEKFVKTGDTLVPMRHLIAILIVFLLPVQWTFAAVSTYCRHEATPAAQIHAGHHDHEHVGAVKKAAKVDSSGFEDLDCPSCLTSFVNAVVMAEMPSLHATTAVPILWHSHLIPDRSPDNPFRPPHTAGA
ncbi:MAG: hypothetical protein JNN20_18845 [Betaproteobacteria bacterium]|nr:hypothetical protein [Betaproteobacteria bacterium]